MATGRSLAFVIALVIAVGSTLAAARAQSDFDPVATAKLRAGEIAREIAASARDPAVPAPSRDAVFNTGLLLQAGLRALLPPQQRAGVALPGTPAPGDPSELTLAQENYKAVFAAGAEATPAQRATALKSIELAAQRLQTAGYTALAKRVTDWLTTQR